MLIKIGRDCILYDRTCFWLLRLISSSKDTGSAWLMFAEVSSAGGSNPEWPMSVGV